MFEHTYGQLHLMSVASSLLYHRSKTQDEEIGVDGKKKRKRKMSLEEWNKTWKTKGKDWYEKYCKDAGW